DVCSSDLACRLPGLTHHRPPRYEGDVAALPLHAERADVDGVVDVRDVLFDRAVEPDPLEEVHRVGILDGGQQQPAGVLGSGGDHDLETRDVDVDGLGRLRVVLGGTDATAVRHPDHHR